MLGLTMCVVFFFPSPPSFMGFLFHFCGRNFSSKRQTIDHKHKINGSYSVSLIALGCSFGDDVGGDDDGDDDDVGCSEYVHGICVNIKIYYQNAVFLSY